MIDKAKAIAAICELLRSNELFKGKEDLSGFVGDAVEADLAYISKVDDGYYDDDDAFEYIVEALLSKTGVDDEAAIDLAELIASYMDAMEQYLQQEDMIDWE